MSSRLSTPARPHRSSSISPTEAGRVLNGCRGNPNPRPCACGCGVEVSGGPSKRYATKACQLRAWREQRKAGAGRDRDLGPARVGGADVLTDATGAVYVRLTAPHLPCSRPASQGPN
jgi:hypothetical protein